MRNEGQRLYRQALRIVTKNRKDPKQCARALPLLERALSLGDVNAAYALGTWYLHGHVVRQDVRKGTGLLKQAAKGNQSDALFDLAVSFETGVGVKKSEQKAFEGYVAAALHGDAQAVYEVGRCYFYGIGTKKDRRLAKIWYERAKALGVTKGSRYPPDRLFEPREVGQKSARGQVLQ